MSLEEPSLVPQEPIEVPPSGRWRIRKEKEQEPTPNDVFMHAMKYGVEKKNP